MRLLNYVAQNVDLVLTKTRLSHSPTLPHGLDSEWGNERRRNGSQNAMYVYMWTRESPELRIFSRFHPRNEDAHDVDEKTEVDENGRQPRRDKEPRPVR